MLNEELKVNGVVHILVSLVRLERRHSTQIVNRH